MKSILLCGTAALLLSVSGALAQDDHHDAGGHPDAGTHAGGDAHASGSMSGPGDQHGDTTTHDDKGAADTHTTHTTHTRHTTRTSVHNTNVHDTNVHDTNIHRTNIDITTYRRAEPATHHFNIGVYHEPPGYSYRRYGVGERLDAAFYARDYWLTNWSSYNLVAPPDGYVWVRFGPDAILIDQSTGEVVQVQYGIFS